MERLLPEKGVSEEIGKRAGGISHETVRKVETLIDKAPDRVIQGLRTGHLKTFPNECIDCCVTSPPYWKLRDYQADS